MAIDQDEDDTANVVAVSDYGIEVDFEQLEEEEEAVCAFMRLYTYSRLEQDGSPEMDRRLEKAITALVDEIQKMTPNMKAVSKCVKLLQ
jgi:structural maintenance of chromosome 1